ncbi:MAG: hypothetical protein J6K61_04890 [Clostridia bacterium]|nr:hypothetical protein [Clostridia bacterium]
MIEQENNPVLTEEAPPSHSQEEHTEEPREQTLEDEPSVDSPLEQAPEEEEAPAVDYARLAEEDLKEIKSLDSSYAHLRHLGELPNARRFAALRDLGLSVKEALAASHPHFTKENGKAHLRPSLEKGAVSPLGVLSSEEMRHAKELFSDLNDGEIQALYRRVKPRY